MRPPLPAAARGGFAACLLLAAAACGEADPPAVACEDPVPSRASGAPMDTVRVDGVPKALGDSLYAELRLPGAPEDSVSGLAAVRRTGPSSVLLAVPAHPSLRLGGGPAELTITDGSTSCAAFPFTIDSLPPAPGTLRAMLGSVREILDAELALAGLSSGSLASARPDTLPDVLVPFLELQRTLDASDAGPRPRRRAAAAGSSGTAGDRVGALVDAMLANTGLPRMLRRRLEGFRVFLEERDPDRPGWLELLRGGAGGEIGGPSARGLGSARPGLAPEDDRTRRAATGPARRRGSAAVLASTSGSAPRVAASRATPRPTATPAAGRAPPAARTYGVSPGALSYMMDLAFLCRQTPAQAAMLDAAATGFATSAALFAIEGGALAAAGSDRMGEAAMAVWAADMIMGMLADVLPSRLTDLRVRAAPRVFEEDRDEEGRLLRIEVVATSNGHSFDQDIADTALQALLMGNSALKERMVEGMPELAGAANEAIDFIQGEILGRALSGSTGGSGVIYIRPERWVADARDPRWTEVHRTGPPAVRMTGHHTYRPVDVGTSELLIFTKPTIATPSQIEKRGWAAAFLGVFGFQQIRATVEIEVERISVEMDPAWKKVGPGERVTVTARVLDAQDPDVEWDVLQGGATLEAQSRDGDVNRAEVVIPDPMQGRVLVKATSTADRSHLRSGRRERAGVSRLHDEEIEVADVCTPGAMEWTVSQARSSPLAMVEAGAFDPSGTKRPGDGSIRFSGLVDDQGVGCSHHVAAYVRGGTLPFMGGGGAAAAEEMREQAARLQRLARQAAGADGALDGSGDEGRGALLDSLAEARALAGPDSAEAHDVVFQVYSPNGHIWQSGFLPGPRVTQHTLLGGWQPNAAALLSVQLPGTAAHELEAGGSYEAVAATGPLEEGLKGTSPVTPTARAFYTSWRGDLEPVPWDDEEDRRNCLRAKQMREQMDFTEHLVGTEKFHCRFDGYAFEGVTRTVTGRLEGTVVIDSITSGYLRGRFRLGGSGKLVETRYEIRRDRQGRVLGDRRMDQETRTGPLEVQGGFRAPNRRSGLARMVGLQTVVVPADGAGGDREDGGPVDP